MRSRSITPRFAWDFTWVWAQVQPGMPILRQLWGLVREKGAICGAPEFETRYDPPAAHLRPNRQTVYARPWQWYNLMQESIKLYRGRLSRFHTWTWTCDQINRGHSNEICFCEKSYTCSTWHGCHCLKTHECTCTCKHFQAWGIMVGGSTVEA